MLGMLGTALANVAKQSGVRQAEAKGEIKSHCGAIVQFRTLVD
jgi:hypothetical protein